MPGRKPCARISAIARRCRSSRSKTGSLKVLRGNVAKGSNITLLQLLGGHGPSVGLASAGESTRYGDLLKPEGLREVAAYTDAIGPTRALPSSLLQSTE